MTDDATLYDQAGGEPFFVRLVDAFYEAVATDAVLRPMYAEADLAGPRRRLTLFLMQYWGGPTTYHDERGHPMLRMRHMLFHVDPIARDRWLLHMAAAVEREAPSPDVARRLMDYFVPAAEHLRNDTGLPISTRRPAG